MLAIILTIIAVASRLIIHSWNFTPVIVVALFSGSYLPKKKALLVSLGSLLLTDIILGFHATIPFTWGSVILVVLLGGLIKGKVATKNVILAGLSSAALFFVITNFGAWIFYYPKTWVGLVECYTLAIPFFRNSLISTFAYSVVLFGVYELAAARLRKSARFAQWVTAK